MNGLESIHRTFQNFAFEINEKSMRIIEGKLSREKVYRTISAISYPTRDNELLHTQLFKHVFLTSSMATLQKLSTLKCLVLNALLGAPMMVHGNE